MFFVFLNVDFRFFYFDICVIEKNMKKFLESGINIMLYIVLIFYYCNLSN